MNKKKLMKYKKPENFTKGLYCIEIPQLGEPSREKVRDNWIIQKGKSKFRLIITTDRQSISARVICTIFGKGQISNLISGYWFEVMKNIIPNHMLVIPHPNILIAR